MKRIATTALGGLVGGLAGFGFVKILLQVIPGSSVRLLFHAPGGWGEGFAKVLAVGVGLWGGIAVHELAHLLTGLAVGFRFYLYVAGYLGVRRNVQTDRVEAYLNRDPNLFGGVAATVPIRQEANLRQKLAAVCAAGPLASLLTSTLSIFLSLYAIQTIALASPYLRVVLVFGLVFGVISLLLFLATTLPTRTGPFFTDRARFFRLMGGGHAAQVEQAMLELLAHSQSGLPNADLNPDQITLLSGESQPFVRCYAYTLAYYRHLDRAEYSSEAFEAIVAADALLDNQPLLFKNEVWREVGFAFAFLGNDADAARRVLNHIKPAFEQERTACSYLTRAAVALAEGQLDQARQWVEQGQQALPDEVTKGEDKFG